MERKNKYSPKLSPLLSFDSKIIQTFTLSMLHERRTKEYNFISHFLSDLTFPQRKLSSKTKGTIKIVPYSSDIDTYKMLVEKITDIENSYDLLIRAIYYSLLKNPQVLDVVNESEVIIPLISVKKDLRGFFIVPSLKFRNSKWEWWANIENDKIKRGASIALLQDVT